MNVISKWLRQLFCSHSQDIIRTRGRVLFTECLRCGRQSKGIRTGGFSRATADNSLCYRLTAFSKSPELQEKWIRYTESRVATYEFRARTRYKAVADKLFAMGLNNEHTILDVGAGACQFGRYLRERGFRGRYYAVDAVLDGTDLEVWNPSRRYDFIVSIEVIEHLHSPVRLIGALNRAARLGVVLTTPNSEALDVLKCDPTHVSVVPAQRLAELGFCVERESWFGTPEDSLLAWRLLASTAVQTLAITAFVLDGALA